MNAELPALLRAVIVALRETVRPHVDDEQARIQLASALDILGKLEGMAEWSPEALRQQAVALQAGCDAFEALAARSGHRLPPASDVEATALRSAELRTGQLTDWLFAQHDLAAPLRAELDAVLRNAMRQQLLAERQRIPLTDFASMTAGGGPRDG